MVFHEIERISDVVSGHRIIIYYIEDGTESKWKLRKSVESVMEMLEKKNDDLIIFKVSQNTQEFSQFKELYKPEINSPVALFVINTEGIPLICAEINKEDSIYQAFESVCTNCKLNFASKVEVTKVLNCEIETFSDKSIISHLLNRQHKEPSDFTPQASKILCGSDSSGVGPGSNFCKDNQESVQSITVILQIRLPDGTKENQKFDEHTSLQEVYDFIVTRFTVKDFDLKTYNRNVFSAEDYEKTLQELDLTPTGVIIVVYKNVIPYNGTSSISTKIQYGIWILFGKFTPIFKYFHGLLFAFWNSFFSSGNRTSTQIQNQSEGSHSSAHKSTSAPVKKPSSRFGNIHTLRRSEDSDDENNRYNGNSTQQK